jgi:hypothetical protein
MHIVCEGQKMQRPCFNFGLFLMKIYDFAKLVQNKPKLHEFQEQIHNHVK